MTDLSYRLRASLIGSVLFALLLWWIHLADLWLSFDLGRWGVDVQQASGLWGIVFAPLLHGSWMHLIGNTLPVIVLGTLLFYGYPRSAHWALFIIWIGAGMGVWWFARPAVHLGASGLTHGVLFFLLLASILRRDKRSVVMMMVGFFLYGGMLMSIFPRESGISFEYHFFGAVFGCLSAVLFYRRDPKPPRKVYDWEQDDSDDDTIGDEWKANASTPMSEDSGPSQQKGDADAGKNSSS